MEMRHRDTVYLQTWLHNYVEYRLIRMKCLGKHVAYSPWRYNTIGLFSGINKVYRSHMERDKRFR